MRLSIICAIAAAIPLHQMAASATTYVLSVPPSFSYIGGDDLRNVISGNTIKERFPDSRDTAQYFAPNGSYKVFGSAPGDGGNYTVSDYDILITHYSKSHRTIRILSNGKGEYYLSETFHGRRIFIPVVIQNLEK